MGATPGSQPGPQATDFDDKMVYQGSGPDKIIVQLEEHGFDNRYATKLQILENRQPH